MGLIAQDVKLDVGEIDLVGHLLHQIKKKTFSCISEISCSANQGSPRTLSWNW